MTALVTFNVVMGSNQELKARASVDALAKLQVPHARVRRGGAVEEVESTQLVPGDIMLLEAGDVVPADGRITTSATLELQEAALTGESAPVAKDGATVLDGDTVLGDRTNLVFQNTQVTRGTATVVVTATVAATQMGKIADMVTSTQRSRSPLQKELDGMTKAFGLVAWLAVAVIAIFGVARGQTFETLVLLCVSTAISAIPTGLPTFVQTMLSSGAQRLAKSKAVVKSLTDVETLGGTTVINSDKTGTLTLNAMTATKMLAGGEWFRIEGGGYSETGAIYRRITSYVKLQLTILSSVLQLMLLATIFNINGGVALFPTQLLFCKFFVVVTVVIGFIVDVPDPGVMERPPRKPGTKIVNQPQIIRWVLSGFVVALTALLVLDLGPDKPSTTHASVSMTMAFAVVAFTAVNLGVVMRCERQAPWSSPVFQYMGWIILGWALAWAAVELPMLQRLLDTESLSGAQWAIVLGLSLIAPALVWADKAIQLRRQSKARTETTTKVGDPAIRTMA